MEKINVKATLTEGITLGIKNFPSLLGMTVLYAITVWIPYLNVGTTIGLFRSIISISKGAIINPLDIFNKENFSQMGDFFLLCGLKSMGISVATAFMIIPGIVISIAWNYSVYILLEFKKGFADAIHLSEKVTYGEKLTIFLIDLLFGIALCIVAGLFMLIPKIGVVFSVIAILLGSAIYIAILATLYKHFGAKVAALLQ